MTLRSFGDEVFNDVGYYVVTTKVGVPRDAMTTVIFVCVSLTWIVKAG